MRRLPRDHPPPGKPGHPLFDRNSMLCAFMFKALLGLQSESVLCRKLIRNPLLRELCGFLKVPSLRTLNCFLARQYRLLDSVFTKLAARFAKVHALREHLVVDSTPIPVPEKDPDAQNGIVLPGGFTTINCIYWRIVRRNYP